MARTDASHVGEVYYCYPLSQMDDRDERDVLDLVPVSASGVGLVEYLQRYALEDELAGVMRTYLVRAVIDDELVGYFSLKAGLASFNEERSSGVKEFDTVPGVELANFAVNDSYRKSHPKAAGCGMQIFHDLVLPIVREASSIVGIALVYLFSLPEEKVIGNYRRYGFERLGEQEESYLHARLKPRYDQSCVFMYMLL